MTPPSQFPYTHLTTKKKSVIKTFENSNNKNNNKQQIVTIYHLLPRLRQQTTTRANTTPQPATRTSSRSSTSTALNHYLNQFQLFRRIILRVFVSPSFIFVFRTCVVQTTTLKTLKTHSHTSTHAHACLSNRHTRSCVRRKRKHL